MKSLKDFQDQIVETKNVIGGKIADPEVHYGTESERSASDPNCCYKYYDWFVDSNGNGIWDDTWETGGTYNPNGEYICN